MISGQINVFIVLHKYTPQVIKEQLPLQVTQHYCVECAEDSVDYKITSRVHLIFYLNISRRCKF